MNTAPTLPGLEDEIARMEQDAISDAEITQLPTYTAERVANYEPKRYELAARLLFAENLSRRTICKWLKMSPNTLSAIEVRELRLHPELVKKLQQEAKAEIVQIMRMGREELRARFFDKDAIAKTSTKDIATIIKILDDMESKKGIDETEPNRNTGNDYIDAIWQESDDGFKRGKKSAPENLNANKDAAPKNAPGCAESGREGMAASID